MADNVRINYSQIIEAISLEFQTALEEAIAEGRTSLDPDAVAIYNQVKDLEVYVDDEQSFIKRDEISPNAVYIVVKFNQGTANFGASACGVTMLAFGSENKVKPTQTLLSFFASRWSTKTLYTFTNASQVWYTPNIISNFTEAASGFRNLLSMSGTIVIGQSSTVTLGTLTYYYTENNIEKTETIDFMAYSDNFSNSLSPQPFGNTEGFAKSETNFSTFSFSISTYLLNTQFAADCLALRGWRNPNGSGKVSTKGPNDTFKFSLEFSNGFSNLSGANFHREFKLVSSQITQRLGDIPSLSVSFSH